MDEHVRTIEVNGHKFEVDLRTAKKVDTYRVGDRVKVLVKEYSGYSAYPGVIIGIDAFKNLPTIVIGYIKSVFSSDGKISFAYLNAQSEDIEICPMSEDDVVPNRETVIAWFDKSITAKEAEVDEIRTRKEYFLRRYGVAFGAAKDEVAVATADPDSSE